MVNKVKITTLLFVLTRRPLPLCRLFNKQKRDDRAGLQSFTFLYSGPVSHPDGQ